MRPRDFFFLLLAVLGAPPSYAEHSTETPKSKARAEAPEIDVRLVCKCTPFGCTASINSLKKLGLVGSVANYSMDVSGSSSVTGTASGGGSFAGVSASVSAGLTVSKTSGKTATIYNSIEDDNLSDEDLIAKVTFSKAQCDKGVLDPKNVVLPKGFKIRGHSSGALSVTLEMADAVGGSASLGYAVAHASATFESSGTKSLTTGRATTQQPWSVTSEEGQTLASFNEEINKQVKGASEHVAIHLTSEINKEIAGSKILFDASYCKEQTCAKLTKAQKLERALIEFELQRKDRVKPLGR